MCYSGGNRLYMILRKYFNILVGFSVLIVVSLQLVAWAMPASPNVIDRLLSDIIPSEIEGFEFEILPLESIGITLKDIDKHLGHDDIFYGKYTHENFAVNVYVSFWKPGKSPYDLAGYHSPDVCWLSQGWVREDREYAVEKKLGHISLKPVEFGVYSMDGAQTEVLFWHLIGGKPNRYKTAVFHTTMAARFDRMLNMFRDAKRLGIGNPSEQLFIRISSETSFDELWPQADFQRLLVSLKPLGIFEESED